MKIAVLIYFVVGILLAVYWWDKEQKKPAEPAEPKQIADPKPVTPEVVA